MAPSTFPVVARANLETVPAIPKVTGLIGHARGLVAREITLAQRNGHPSHDSHAHLSASVPHDSVRPRNPLLFHSAFFKALQLLGYIADILTCSKITSFHQSVPPIPPQCPPKFRFPFITRSFSTCLLKSNSSTALFSHPHCHALSKFLHWCKTSPCGCVSCRLAFHLNTSTLTSDAHMMDSRSRSTQWSRCWVPYGPWISWNLKGGGWFYNRDG